MQVQTGVQEVSRRVPLPWMLQPYLRKGASMKAARSIGEQKTARSETGVPSAAKVDRQFWTSSCKLEAFAKHAKTRPYHVTL